MSKVADVALAPQGRRKVEWAENHMPVLMALRQRFSRTKPFKGIRIAGCLHVTKETAVLVETLRDCGATVAWSGCNPLSTQDDVAAALAASGTSVFAWRGLNQKEYYWCIEQVLKMEPHLTVDDGADLVFYVHEKLPKLIPKIMGGCEETTTGMNRIRAMDADDKLLYPVVSVADAKTKKDFDNIWGTGQSTIDGILRATNVMLAGKNFVVCGFGAVGRGIAYRARGMGAHVIVTEINPLNALTAKMEGFEVLPMEVAASVGEIFVTATGGKDILTGKHFSRMKDGAVLANSGHFNVEINIGDLEKLSKSKKEMRPNNVEYVLKNGRRLYLLAEGRLVNLSAAEGHPSEVMDLSFANQFLSLLFLVKNRGKLENKVYEVPAEQDDEIAELKLATMGVQIDKLSADQKKYSDSYSEGT